MHFVGQDILFLIAFILTGIIGGFCAGFFGLGGGVLYIPVLLTLFGVLDPHGTENMHVAVGTSLALIVPSSIAAMTKQYTLGNIDFHFLRPWILFVFIGSLIGAVTIRYIPGFALKIIFNVFLYIAVIITFLKGREIKDTVTNIPKKYLKGFAVFTGCFSVILGIGGGTMTVPFLKALHYPYRKAIAVASVSAGVIGIVGTLMMIFNGLHVPHLPNYSLGFVNWLGWLCIFPLSMIFSPIGASIATNINERLASNLYLMLLCLIAVYTTLHIVFSHG